MDVGPGRSLAAILNSSAEAIAESGRLAVDIPPNCNIRHSSEVETSAESAVDPRKKATNFRRDPLLSRLKISPLAGR